MKTELLSDTETWIGVGYTTVKQILEYYPDTTLITETDKYKYYASNDHWAVLFRMEKPKLMTREEIEAEYGIKIIGVE